MTTHYSELINRGQSLSCKIYYNFKCLSCKIYYSGIRLNYFPILKNERIERKNALTKK